MRRKAMNDSQIHSAELLGRVLMERTQQNTEVYREKYSRNDEADLSGKSAARKS
jgi:hypothetical protein